MSRVSRLMMGLALFGGLSLLARSACADSVVYEDSMGNVLTNATQITLAQFTSGYHILINNGFDTKDFHGIAGSYSSVGDVVADATKIFVTGITGGGLDPGPGLNYQTVSQWSVGANQSQDTKFQYTVTVVQPSAFKIHDDSVTIGAAKVGQGGQINILESAVNPAPPNNNVADNQVLLINTAGTTTGATTDQVFYDPQTSVLIKKDIGIEGGTTSGTSFTDMQQQFSQVGPTTFSTPEPSSLAIAGLSALGMIGFGLRRRKALGA